jgi:hypothetical protein
LLNTLNGTLTNNQGGSGWAGVTPNVPGSGGFTTNSGNTTIPAI